MEGVRIDGRDLRVGMGVGGWDVEWTATHEPTGCKIVWQTHGSAPMSQHKMKDSALAALSLIVELYDPLPSPPK